MVDKWLKQTSLVLMYTTERINPEAYGDEIISADTVIKHLHFSIDQTTRYTQKLQVSSCTHESWLSAFQFRPLTYNP